MANKQNRCWFEYGNETKEETLTLSPLPYSVPHSSRCWTFSNKAAIMSTYQEIISERQFVQVAYAMIFLASTFCLARSAIQVWKRKPMEMQDYLIYFAFMCFLAMSICYLVIVPKIYKIGRVTLGLVEPWPTMLNDIIHYIRMMFVTTTLFWIALWSVKLSLLALYKQLMEGLPRIYMRLWWALFAFCLVVSALCPLHNMRLTRNSRLPDVSCRILLHAPILRQV
tara:strand:- start:2015 stop:2689 length:675 start_codon:yes stop_codon:yes gene_type:complete